MPILGYLDELVLVPLGIALAVRMIPNSILEECRARSQETLRSGKSVSRIAGIVVVAIWIALAALCAAWAYSYVNPS